MKIVFTSFLFLLAVSSNGFAQSAVDASAGSLPPGYWPLAKSQAVVDGLRKIRLAPDLSHLTAGERVAVSKLVEAGRIIEDLYALQRHPEALSALANL